MHSSYAVEKKCVSCICVVVTDIFLFDLEKMIDTQLLSQMCPLCTQCFVVSYSKGWIALIFRPLLAPQHEVLGILMSLYYLHSTLTLTSQTAEKVMHCRGVESSRPVCIGHLGGWSSERAADDRCVLHPLSLMPLTVETVAFANEEQGDDGQNA